LLEEQVVLVELLLVLSLEEAQILDLSSYRLFVLDSLLALFLQQIFFVLQVVLQALAFEEVLLLLEEAFVEVHLHPLEEKVVEERHHPLEEHHHLVDLHDVLEEASSLAFPLDHRRHRLVPFSQE